jgi:two-component system sensor histidine kinase/response regulator
MEPLPVKPRVLVVDDHPANLLAHEVLLEKEFSAVLVDSGPKALEACEHSEFDAILLDVRMPVMDGYETAIELRRRERTRYVPIIFTSAVEKIPVEILQATASGATDYIATPTDPAYLKFKVSSYAQMYLRNKSLQHQVDQLSIHMRKLRADIAKASPLDGVLDTQIKHLEKLSEELKRRTRALECPPLAAG